MMVCGGRLSFLIHASTTHHHTGQGQHAEQQQHEKQQEELQPLLDLEEGVARVGRARHRSTVLALDIITPCASATQQSHHGEETQVPAGGGGRQE